MRTRLSIILVLACTAVWRTRRRLVSGSCSYMLRICVDLLTIGRLLINPKPTKTNEPQNVITNNVAF